MNEPCLQGVGGTMDKRLYNSTVECPVCSEKIEVTKVKTGACRVVSKDSDFCIHYEDLNPVLYDIWVCPFCGYAALADKFTSIGDRDVKKIQESITPKWNRREFSGERTLDNALEAFKLALYNMQVINAKASEMAKICLRLAWLYRYKKDPKEIDFLKFAAEFYQKAYEEEPFPIDKLDEGTCMYMIAELNRRTGNPEKAIKWFSRIVSSPEARKNNALMENVREQIQLVREQLKDQGAEIKI